MARLIEAAVAAAYRARPSSLPRRLLQTLGIATPERRPEFGTLHHLLTTRPEVRRGDVAECGVYQGATLFGIAHLLTVTGSPARLYGFDTFTGLPQPTHHDGAVVGGTLFADYCEVLDRVRRLGMSERITVVRGHFLDTLPYVRHRRFSLVHVDCDLYSSHLQCLRFFLPRMRAGGVFVFDDYHHHHYVGAQRAVDEFLHEHGMSLSYLAPYLPPYATVTNEGSPR